MLKKLVVFGSESMPAYNFYALVNVHTDDVALIDLAKAAVSDANREEAANIKLGRGGCADGFPVEESVRARLKPLGFEFVECPVAVGPWETLDFELTLTDARLNAGGITFARDKGSREIVIPTTTGDIVIDATETHWRCVKQGTHGVLKGSGFDCLEKLICLRGQPAPF